MILRDCRCLPMWSWSLRRLGRFSHDLKQTSPGLGRNILSHSTRQLRLDSMWRSRLHHQFYVREIGRHGSRPGAFIRFDRSDGYVDDEAVRPRQGKPLHLRMSKRVFRAAISSRARFSSQSGTLERHAVTLSLRWLLRSVRRQRRVRSSVERAFICSVLGSANSNILLHWPSLAISGFGLLIFQVKTSRVMHHLVGRFALGNSEPEGALCDMSRNRSRRNTMSMIVSAG